MAAEMARVVKPGGKIFIDWPFLQPAHGFPSHYYNATRNGLRALFDSHFDIARLTTDGHQGPDYTVQWIVSWLLNAVGDKALRKRLASKTIGEIAAELPQSDFWRDVLKSLDDKAIETLSCGNSLIGTRKNTPADAANGEYTERAVTSVQMLSRDNRPWWRRLFR